MYFFPGPLRKGLIPLLLIVFSYNLYVGTHADSSDFKTGTCLRVRLRQWFTQSSPFGQYRPDFKMDSLEVLKRVKTIHGAYRLLGMTLRDLLLLLPDSALILRHLRMFLMNFSQEPYHSLAKAYCWRQIMMEIRTWISFAAGSVGSGGSSKIYRNTVDGLGETVFEEDLQASGDIWDLQQVHADWGDYDNDGDPDLLISGLNNANPAVAVIALFTK